MKTIKIPSTKNQISNKYQWPKLKIQNRGNCRGRSFLGDRKVSVIEISDLDIIWDLIIGTLGSFL